MIVLKDGFIRKESVPESIIALAGGHLSRRMYAVVGRSTAMTDAADMA